MNQYITTNIRLEEEDYLRLKEEAARTRKSLSAVIREKISEDRPKKKSPEKIMHNLRKHARENAKYFKGVDGIKIIREMRDNAKW
ncbi:MAG: ribbon-helix-helix protein, CopG family [Candidatus Levybacteria bacterium]|nr:ribbon-helix-helix protein, CopG family [Candidatus Levybacteria bacterium]